MPSDAPNPPQRRLHPARVLTLLLALVFLAAVLHTWRLYDQTSDESAHIAVGVGWLTQHEFRADLLNPPLPRIVVGLGPTLTGARLPNDGTHWQPFTFWQDGNALLNSGHYYRVLYAGRAGTLLFVALAFYLLWSRTRAWLGEWPAALSVFLFFFTPSVLTHSSVATTDICTAVTIFWALDRLTRLFLAPTLRNALLAGLATALAMVSKMTALPFLCVSMLLLFAWTFWRRRRTSTWFLHLPRPRYAAAGFAVLCFVIWGTYLFTVGTLLRYGPSSEAKLRARATHYHLPPAAVAAIVNHAEPAPAFFQGWKRALLRNDRAVHGYFMGKMRPRGSRLFFPVMFAVKFPLPFVLLSLAGLALGFREAFRGNTLWPAITVAGALGPFLVGINARLNIGIRHMLPGIVFLAILAAFAALQLWQSTRYRTACRVVLLLLLTWQAADFATALPDPLPWFNAAALGKGPWFATDSDYDWGQDVGRLPAALAALHATNVSLAVAGSNDLTKLPLPSWKPLQPFRPVTGWVVVSELKSRDELEGFSWITRYKPVAYAGKTIGIYNIPTSTPASKE